VFASRALQSAAAKPRRWNILLITSEDNGPHLSCYGDPYVKTPHLDALAARGVRFSNAYVTQAGCSPSRSSIFTGLYTHQNGQIGLATHGLRMYRKDTPNIFRLLKEAGYATGVIGKIHVNPESAFPLDRHWRRKGGFGNRDVRWEAKTAGEFISASDKPFLLMVNYNDAHRPFIRQQHNLPAKPLGPEDVKVLPEIGLDTPTLRQNTANYYNCMSRLDSGVGMLLKTLARTGKADTTLVIYLGDHGADILRGKRTSYEGGVKIPLIISWPGRMKRRQVRDELVSTVDLMPTILAAVGAEAVAGLPGRSLAPLVRGERGGWRKYLFTEYHLHSGHNFYPQRTVRNGRYKLVLNLLAGRVNPGYAFTNDRFFEPGEIESVLKKSPAHIRRAYEILRVAPKYELYDLKADPCEFHNLAEKSEHGAVLDELKTALADWRRRTKDPLLDSGALKRLKAEVDSRWKTGKYKKNMNWKYPTYFFAAESKGAVR
jgi:N-sulfoglucosamine sulfohydrolase